MSLRDALAESINTIRGATSELTLHTRTLDRLLDDVNSMHGASDDKSVSDEELVQASAVSDAALGLRLALQRCKL